ncbi:hypothetical protein ASE61_23795 [Bosea sp. Root670]|nr:HWE histidine kinase domain-containing protein [Bosea sp. Root670]KRE07017.1 hypothetical protein ASE61_23795 [Bosea sp. Root670]
MQHRIGNIFAVIGSLISMAARAEPASAKFAEEIVGRIRALNRAHGIVLDQSGKRPADNLLDLIGRLVAPYNSGLNPRMTVAGDHIEVGRSASTAIALVLHELATNAVKHGALSSPAGSVEIDARISGETVILRGAETGGPLVVGEPLKRGFGSELVDRALRSQLGAQTHFAWLPPGLVVVIEMDANKIQF